MKLLIDGDPLCYRAAFSQEGQTIAGVCDKLDEIFQNILNATNPYATKGDYKVFLTGKGNFRYKLTDTYKANRVDKEKPILLNLARQYLIDTYGAEVSEGQEADDSIAIEATRLYPDCVIVSIDKDFRQIEGTIYNPMRDTWEKVDKVQALLNFYEQILTGDKVDNIIGINGIGPKKAQKALQGLTTEQEMYKVCVAMYEEHGLPEEQAILNGKLLFLRRYEGQIWEPPIET